MLCLANIVLCCVSITEGNRGIFGFCTEKLISFSVLLRFPVLPFISILVFGFLAKIKRFFGFW